MIAPASTHAPKFRDGDRIAAESLTGWERAPLLSLARHFRYVHREYGVATGLQVSLSAGSKGWEAKLGTGFAYDGIGRVLVCDQEMAIDLGSKPPDSATATSRVFVLRGSVPECGPLDEPIPSPSLRAPLFALIDVKELGEWDVPLAGLRWDSHTNPTIDPAHRARVSQVFRQPYIAKGVLPTGSTSVPIDCGWQVWVDTTEAGFLPPTPMKTDPQPDAWTVQDRPVYLVEIGTQGSLQDAAKLASGKVVLDRSPEAELTSVAQLPSISISLASWNGFMLTVLYSSPQKRPDQFPLNATPLAVNWVGVEQPADIETRENAFNPLKEPDSEGIVVAKPDDQLAFRWPHYLVDHLLTADALNATQQTLMALQCLHNRTLHDWGVAEGLGVTIRNDARGVHIEPGCAVDVDGNNLIIASPQGLAAPASAPQPGTGPQTWWVTAFFRETEAPRGDTTCRQDGVPITLLKEAGLRWRDPQASTANDRLRTGKDIILATVKIDRGEVASVSTSGRRDAVPSRRPYIFAGRTTIPADQWTSGKPVQVDTKAASFLNTPQYLFSFELEDARTWETVPVTNRTLIEPSNQGFKLIVPKSTNNPIAERFSSLKRASTGGVTSLIKFFASSIRPITFGVAALVPILTLPVVAEYGLLSCKLPDKANQAIGFFSLPIMIHLASWVGKKQRGVDDARHWPAYLGDKFITLAPVAAISTYLSTINFTDSNIADATNWLLNQADRVTPQLRVHLTELFKSNADVSMDGAPELGRLPLSILVSPATAAAYLWNRLNRPGILGIAKETWSAISNSIKRALKRFRGRNAAQQPDENANAQDQPSAIVVAWVGIEF